MRHLSAWPAAIILPHRYARTTAGYFTPFASTEFRSCKLAMQGGLFSTKWGLCRSQLKANCEECPRNCKSTLMMAPSERRQASHMHMKRGWPPRGALRGYRCTRVFALVFQLLQTLKDAALPLLQSLQLLNRTSGLGRHCSTPHQVGG